MNTRFTVFLLWSVFSACGVQAGIIHDSVPDANYIAHGALFPATGYLNEGGASGTLIRDRWVITAAHNVEFAVANNIPVIFGTGSNFFSNPGEVYDVSEIVIHPDYVAIGNGPDIALMRLSESVVGVEPAILYEDQLQLGDVLDHVGFGRFGTPSTGVSPDNDGQKRGFRNPVSDFGSDIFRGITDDYVGTIFTPINFSSSTGLDGAGSPGDSGGGVYMEGDLAAVMSLQVGIPDIGALTGSTEILPLIPWINSVVVPEPSSALLLFVGLGVFTYIRR